MSTDLISSLVTSLDSFSVLLLSDLNRHCILSHFSMFSPLFKILFAIQESIILSCDSFFVKSEVMLPVSFLV